MTLDNDTLPSSLGRRPFPADGTNGPDVLDQEGVVRRDIRSSFGTATSRASPT
jgi:hypothetical protein